MQVQRKIWKKLHQIINTAFWGHWGKEEIQILIQEEEIVGREEIFMSKIHKRFICVILYLYVFIKKKVGLPSPPQMTQIKNSTSFSPCFRWICPKVFVVGNRIWAFIPILLSQLYIPPRSSSQNALNVWLLIFFFFLVGNLHF